MNIAIRYFSKFGHSAQMAEVIAREAGVKAETVSVPLDGPTDILFLGAGVFLGRIDKRVAEFIRGLDASQVKCVVCFGSSALSDSPVPLMLRLLKEQGVPVEPRSFSCKGAMGPVHAGHPDQADLDALAAFARGILHP